MKRLTLVALGALALSGCTGTHIKKPTVCDGKHRRPANLYGSVLPSLPVPLPASQGGGQSMVAPGPGPGPAMLPPPPVAPQGAVAPAPAPTAVAPAAGNSNSKRKTSQTSQRDIALSYYSC